MVKCDICGKEYFNRGLGCTKDFTCEDIKTLYNKGKPLKYKIDNFTKKESLTKTTQKDK